MTKPSEQIIKEYPSRGHMTQFRSAKPVSFTCSRCRQTKTAKLIAIYNDKWDRMVCNGCYGQLISIADTESGHI